MFAQLKRLSIAGVAALSIATTGSAGPVQANSDNEELIGQILFAWWRWV
jgi:hypothetical protein